MLSLKCLLNDQVRNTSMKLTNERKARDLKWMITKDRQGRCQQMGVGREDSEPEVHPGD